jgi:hypothetical protein
MLAKTTCAALLTAAGLAAQVPLSVQVLNKPGGKTIEGLTIPDWTVSQGDRTLEIASVRLEERPLDLVVVVEQRRWEPLDAVVQDSLGALTSRLRSDDRAGLLVAGTGVTAVVPPGSAPGVFAMALSKSRVDPGIRLPRPVPSERGPVIYDAILTAVEHVPADDARRRVVLVIGSGYDNSSQSNIASLTAAALQEGVIVSLAELPEETFRTQGGVIGQPAPVYDPTGRGGDARIPPQSRIPPPFPTPRPLPKRTGRTLTTLIQRSGGERSDDWRGGHGLSAMADRQRTRYELELRSFDSRFGDAEVRLEGAAARKNKKAEILVLQARPVD